MQQYRSMFRGPIWIDPTYLQYNGWPSQGQSWTTATITTTGVTEDRVRRIVREEIASLPIRFDVPDEPPAA